ncbi:MAG: hypothetical protein K2J00_00215, partial [Bacteroidaceae bacterium]|nr:hypothetical protein [Bacteroidaceae bacterium]
LRQGLVIQCSFVMTLQRYGDNWRNDSLLLSPLCFRHLPVAKRRFPLPLHVTFRHVPVMSPSCSRRPLRPLLPFSACCPREVPERLWGQKPASVFAREYYNK